jgi:hypothetical protein
MKHDLPTISQSCVFFFKPLLMMVQSLWCLLINPYCWWLNHDVSCSKKIPPLQAKGLAEPGHIMGRQNPAGRWMLDGQNPVIISGWCLNPTPLKNMSSSVGVTIPNISKNNIHVPNHQPDMLLSHTRNRVS